MPQIETVVEAIAMLLAVGGSILLCALAFTIC